MFPIAFHRQTASWACAAILVAGAAAAGETMVAPGETPLARASAAAQPGDVILLADGTYGTPIRPARSGEPGKPIVYRAAPGAKPVFTGMLIAIDLRDRSHIAIEGITVKDVKRFLVAKKSSCITIDRCTFDTGLGWESCSMKDMGDSLRFTNNSLRNGTDLCSIQGGNFHLIEGNSFDTAAHETLTLMGVQRSVVRGNRFTNPIQKLTSFLTTREGEWDKPPRKTELVLFENNVFGPAWIVSENGTRSGSGSAAIQYCACRNILRRNVYKRCGLGMDFSGDYGDMESKYNRSNRFYNNTIYDCGWAAVYASGPGISLGNPSENYGDQVIANNILYRNRIFPDAHRPKSIPQTIQVRVSEDPAVARFFGNDICGEFPGDKVFWTGKAKPALTLKEYEAKNPQFAFANLDADPQFVDPDSGDFRLKPGSPCVDAGAPLTKTKGAGKGTDVEVEDALFFCDGYGIVEPDTIRVGQARAKIAKVDYEANRIALAEPISWEAGAPVSLDYVGKAPDIGAFESGTAPGK